MADVRMRINKPMKIEKSSYILACVTVLAGAPILIFREKCQLIYDLAQESMEMPFPIKIFVIISPMTWLVVVLFLALLFIIKDFTSFAKWFNFILIVALLMLYYLFMMMLIVPIGVV
jgi:glucan phosphoethanolaminetransferase (alkaline phosphatase superfamily)